MVRLIFSDQNFKWSIREIGYTVIDICAKGHLIDHIPPTLFQFFSLCSTTFYDFRSIRWSDLEPHAKLGVVCHSFCTVRNSKPSKIGLHGSLKFATFSVVFRTNRTLQLGTFRVPRWCL